MAQRARRRKGQAPGECLSRPGPVAALGEDGGALRPQTPRAPSEGKSVAQPSKACGGARESAGWAAGFPQLRETTETTTPPVGEDQRLCSAGVQALPEQQGQEPAEQGRKPREGARGVQAEQRSEEQLEEGHGARPAGGLPSALGPLERLQGLQVAMQPVNSYASQALAQLRQCQGQRRKPHLGRRGRLIQAIPGFWRTTMASHPDLSRLISEQDKDMLGYMTNLEVEERRGPPKCCEISMFFQSNRYFLNKLILKGFVWQGTGYRASHSSAIQWHSPFRLEACTPGRRTTSSDFFNWFTGRGCAGCHRITQIIVEDLWPNPLPYYKPRKPPGEQEKPTDGQRVNPQRHLPQKVSRATQTAPDEDLEDLCRGLIALGRK